MTDVAFKAAHLDFDNTVHRIIGLRSTTVHRCLEPKHRPDCRCSGVETAWHPSMYTQIREDIGGLSGDVGHGVSASRPPLWVDGIDWLDRIDTLAATWTPDLAGGTVARLDELTFRPFGPDHTGWLVDATKKLGSIANTGDQLLQGEEVRRFDVVAPCPECGKATVYRKDSGNDMVRKTALQLTINGCACLACGARWDREHLNFLAEVIGCEREELA